MVVRGCSEALGAASEWGERGGAVLPLPADAGTAPRVAFRDNRTTQLRGFRLNQETQRTAEK